MLTNALKTLEFVQMAIVSTRMDHSDASVPWDTTWTTVELIVLVGKLLLVIIEWMA